MNFDKIVGGYVRPFDFYVMHEEYASTPLNLHIFSPSKEYLCSFSYRKDFRRIEKLFYNYTDFTSEETISKAIHNLKYKDQLLDIINEE